MFIACMNLFLPQSASYNVGLPLTLIDTHPVGSYAL